MAEIQITNFKIAKAASDQTYLAYLDITNSNLYVEQRDGSLALVGAAEDFGACTEAELAARTYTLAVQTVLDPSVSGNEDYVIAFGRTQKS